MDGEITTKRQNTTSTARQIIQQLNAQTVQNSYRIPVTRRGSKSNNNSGSCLKSAESRDLDKVNFGKHNLSAHSFSETKQKYSENLNYINSHSDDNSSVYMVVFLKSLILDNTPLNGSSKRPYRPAPVKSTSKKKYRIQVTGTRPSEPLLVERTIPINLRMM